jgi:chaperonin cofactor prefoldin
LRRLDDLKEQIAAVATRVDRLEAQMATRFDAVDRRFEAIDRRFEAIDRRFEAIEQRFDALERRWTWPLGLVLVMALGLLAKLLIPGA